MSDFQFVATMLIAMIGGFVGLGLLFGGRLNSIKAAADCLLARTAILEHARAIDIMIFDDAPAADIERAQERLAVEEQNASRACS